MMMKFLNLPFFSKKKKEGQQLSPLPSRVPKERKKVTSQEKIKRVALQTFAKGLISVKDVIAPSVVEVDFDSLKINSKYYKTLFVAGYPRFVSANWLYPLISYDRSLFISMFVYPTESKVILEDLKRKIAEMEATIQSDIKRGRVVDPSVQVALDDALALQAQLAKGAERFFQFGLYITIPADSLEELNRIAKEVESTLGSLLIISKHATLQMEEGFKSTLPLGVDKLNITRNMDTTSLATTFPFTTASLTENSGILYGINEHDGSLVIFDRFSLENSNSVLFGKSGSGKSVSAHENVLIKESGRVRLVKIGRFVDTLIERFGALEIAKDIEGVADLDLEVFSFNPQSLKGEWSKVTVAARKKISKRSPLYKITTKSGREVTITPDHCTVVLRKGEIRAIRTQDIKVGENIPLLRKLPQPEHIQAKLSPTTLIKDWPDFLPRLIQLDKKFLGLLGLITSKGRITNTKIEICSDSRVLQELIVKSARALGIRIKSIKTKRKKTRGFRLFSKHFASFIHKIKGGGRAGEKRVPPLLFSLSNKQVAAYLRAYFESDGCVEGDKVTCITKSKELVSDLTYLLLRFGIIARIHKKFKRATNSNYKGNYSWELVVSGQNNLRSFAKNIGFLTYERGQKLKSLLGKKENTNVDVIPSLEPVFQEIYQKLYPGTEVQAPQNLSPLKRSVFSPSRAELKNIISEIEERIKEIKSLRAVEKIIRRGKKNRRLNHRLWKHLGQTWRIMKGRRFQPLTTTLLRAYKAIDEETVVLPETKQVVYETFQGLGEPIKYFDRSLQSVFTNRPNGDISFTVEGAADFLQKKQHLLQQTAHHLENKLNQLKLLANSDLFWDEIVKIEKIKNKDPYVYDLTVDNEVFLAGMGGMFVHNSFLVKLEAMRSLMFGTDVFVIDPEGEYKDLTKVLGGEFIEFSFASPVKINPFDLSGRRATGENELGLKILSLHSLMKVIMGKLSPSEEAILDRALVLTYKQKGITPDPATQDKEPPLMEDLYKVLIGMEEAEAKTLAERLEKFIKGSLAGIFNQKSNLDIKNPFTVFCIKDLEATLRPIAMFIILDFIWTKIKKDLKKRILVVDEAWYLMKHPDSALFLYGIAKRARKYYLGLTTITQDVEDFLASDHGKAIITNSSIQILLKQSPAAIDKIAKVFYLSGGEKHFLLSCEIGEGLFFAGSSHVAIKVIAAPHEYEIVTSKPEELLRKQAIAKEDELAGKTQDKKPFSLPPRKPSDQKEGEVEKPSPVITS